MESCELLEQLELRLLNPTSRANLTLLAELIADDFIEVGANGRSFSKAEVLALLPSETCVIFQSEHLRVKLLSATVGFVTYTATRTTDGVSIKSKRCSVWHLNEGQWQIVYHQGTVAQP
jgi:hypothetical protein